jgi:hypothetical protein
MVVWFSGKVLQRAARREVKNWRLTQLATVSRQHHLDPLTEWYMLAYRARKRAHLRAHRKFEIPMQARLRSWVGH